MGKSTQFVSSPLVRTRHDGVYYSLDMLPPIKPKKIHFRFLERRFFMFFMWDPTCLYFWSQYLDGGGRLMICKPILFTLYVQNNAYKWHGNSHTISSFPCEPTVFPCCERADFSWFEPNQPKKWYLEATAFVFFFGPKFSPSSRNPTWALSGVNAPNFLC